VNTDASDNIGNRALAPGQLIINGRYRVDREVGSGAMGTVYLVTHLSLNEPRALKIIRPDVLSDDASLARFRREAQVQSRVRHPNVVTVHDFGESPDSNVWMILEYANGVALDELLEREGRFTPERSAAILLGVCRGVAAAHAAGIIHRDLKPANILITRGPDGRESPKVLDFGIARPVSLLGEGGTASRLTHTNMLVGTPAYLSPDQLSEDIDHPLDFRSDVYTLGVIAIELLTGTIPTRCTTLAEMLRRTTMPLPSLAALCPDVAWPPALERALERATRIDRNERTSSAMEFCDEVCTAIIDGGLGDPSRIFPEWTPRSIPAVRTPAPTATQSVAPSGRGRARGAILVASLGVLAAAGWAMLGTANKERGGLATGMAASGAVTPVVDSVATIGATRGQAGEADVGGRTRDAAGARPPVSDGAAAAGIAPAFSAELETFLASAERGTEEEGALRSRLREGERLLSLSRGQADSVAIGYVLLEADLLLGQDADACRRLRWLRNRSAGTRFGYAVALVADSLPCTL